MTPLKDSMLGVCTIATALVLASCGAPPRLDAVPHELEDVATALDNPALRSWGDVLSPAFKQELIEAARRLNRSQAGADAAGQILPTQFLALSGGGAEGAFGAGLLCGWTAHGGRPEFTVVTGVSTGALIAPFAFLGSEYDDVLRQLYTSVRTREIATPRPILSALLGDALMSTAPLRARLAEVVNEPMKRAIAAEYERGRMLVVATTNFDADRAMIWNIGAIAASDHPDALKLIHDVLIASAAIPAAFPPVMIDVVANGKAHQEMHLDGGTKSQVILYPPSLELRAEASVRGVDRKRIAYIIRNARLEREWASVPRRTIPIARRAISSLIHANGVGDLFRIYLIARRDSVEFNLAYIPGTFRADRAEEFDPVFMTQLFDLGFELASAPDGYQWATSPPGWSEGEAAFMLEETPGVESGQRP